MNKVKIAYATGVAAVIALGTAVPAVAASANAMSVEDLIPALAAPQHESDRAPGGLDLVALGGIDEDSLRSLGGDEAGEYWVGRAGGAEVCLVTRLAADPELAASTCTPITEFYRKGLALVAALGAEDPTLAAEAYLLPSDIGAEPLDLGLASRSTDTEPNLISGRPDHLETLEAFEVHRADGSSFHFAPISLTGGQR
ncbi:hypothetical protein [Cellulomonas sp. GbtcB1]|uniref:hypothetical protein n=1 Tax=Cellulomonas sp. GbtcB1 TaxID=2824746 RepID=UPI001C300C88|nr:hypothetical protein [Cellulomonas sp. GbtcB1]